MKPGKWVGRVNFICSGCGAEGDVVIKGESLASWTALAIRLNTVPCLKCGSEKDILRFGARKEIKK